jgi:hypothetical protein
MQQDQQPLSVQASPPRRRTAALVAGLTLLCLGLAFFGAPGTSRAEESPNGTVPGGTVPPIPPLRPSVTFVHAAPFDIDTMLTAVDVCTEENTVVAGLESLIFGEARTLYFDPNAFDWKIAVAGSNCQNVLVDIDEFGLGYSAIKVLVFTGDRTKQPLQVIDVLAREGGGVIFMPFLARAGSQG